MSEAFSEEAAKKEICAPASDERFSGGEAWAEAVSYFFFDVASKFSGGAAEDIAVRQPDGGLDGAPCFFIERERLSCGVRHCEFLRQDFIGAATAEASRNCGKFSSRCASGDCAGRRRGKASRRA